MELFDTGTKTETSSNRNADTGTKTNADYCCSVVDAIRRAAGGIVHPHRTLISVILRNNTATFIVLSGAARRLLRLPPRTSSTVAIHMNFVTVSSCSRIILTVLPDARTCACTWSPLKSAHLQPYPLGLLRQGPRSRRQTQVCGSTCANG